MYKSSRIELRHFNKVKQTSLLLHKQLSGGKQNPDNGEDGEKKDGSTMSPAGPAGSGVGKGGGGGGTIRSAGGGLGKMAASQEESYFHKPTRGSCVLVKVLQEPKQIRDVMGCVPKPGLSTEDTHGLRKLAVTQEETYYDQKTMEQLEKLQNAMEKSLESARKSSDEERDKDQEVEDKMKKLSGQFKDLIDKGKKK